MQCWGNKSIAGLLDNFHKVASNFVNLPRCVQQDSCWMMLIKSSVVVLFLLLYQPHGLQQFHYEVLHLWMDLVITECHTQFLILGIETWLVPNVLTRSYDDQHVPFLNLIPNQERWSLFKLYSRDAIMCPRCTTLLLFLLFSALSLWVVTGRVHEGRVLIYLPKIHISIFLVPDNLKHLSSSQTEEVLYVRWTPRTSWRACCSSAATEK